MALTPPHRELLTRSAITPEVIETSGIESTPTGVRFPWTDGTSPVVWQDRPDDPKTDAKGDPVKYLFPKGARVPFNRLRDDETCTRVLIVEGTKQQYAALSHAPREFAVYGMSGCWGFRNADLTVADGRDVFLLLDADIESNLDVWTAAQAHAKLLKRSGATDVHHVLTTGQGKDGLDDVLAKLTPAKRGPSLKLWLSQAQAVLPTKPKAKRPTTSTVDGDAVKFFRQREKPLVFQPHDFATGVLEKSPAVMTREGNIALYSGGVYQVDGNAILTLVVQQLGNFYATGYLAQVKDTLKGILYGRGAVLPERMDAPMLNCPNGMVDLRTGALLPHDPKWMSHIQVTTDFLPDVPTPVYDRWIREALRQDGHTDAELDALVQDLEEAVSVMLNPSIRDKKVLFLYGPSRSGKSTLLRLLKAIAGALNTSAVTLHDLGTDTFATANLYGKMLNVAADLSNRHVEDLSKFKMATGADELHANRKYGAQFTFTNTSLFAFSANELPTVSEASKAYSARVKPFAFPNTFLGREDMGLEDKLMAELPGILARWVAAHRSFLARGGYGATDARTDAEFQAKSDRVVQFFQDMCTPTGAVHGQRVGDSEGTGRRDAAVAFNAWAERNGGSKMGERAFFQRFSQIEGVAEVRMGAKDRRGYSVVVAKADDDAWAAGGTEPVADPIPPSGVLAPQDPWGPPGTPVDAWGPGTIGADLYEPQTAPQGLALTAAAGPVDPFTVDGPGYDF